MVTKKVLSKCIAHSAHIEDWWESIHFVFVFWVYRHSGQAEKVPSFPIYALRRWSPTLHWSLGQNSDPTSNLLRWSVKVCWYQNWPEGIYCFFFKLLNSDANLQKWYKAMILLPVKMRQMLHRWCMKNPAGRSRDLQFHWINSRRCGLGNLFAITQAKTLLCMLLRNLGLHHVDTPSLALKIKM